MYACAAEIRSSACNFQRLPRATPRPFPCLGGAVKSGAHLRSAATATAASRRGSRHTVGAGGGGGEHKVLLTRERGKNDKMAALMAQHKLAYVELPLIEHGDGPDRSKLPLALANEQFDWVVLTSPEAVHVFLEAWRQAGEPQVRLAAVGGGTGDLLSAVGLAPQFVPSQAIGKVMASEMPRIEGGAHTVLYPASCKASTDVESGLRGRGFQVTRLNTYDTRGVGAVPEHALHVALEADVITFGSPSAVKSWVQLVGLERADEKVNVCIGSTSARACAAAGLSKVVYPENPGIESWAECVVQQCTAAA